MRATTKGWIGAVALGIISAGVGLLPWWMTGARLPLQNLWGTITVDMPFALVPFSQYYVPAVATYFIVGAGVAGLITGFIPALRVHRWWVVFGVSGLQALALAQSALVTLLGLRGDGESQLYFAVIIAMLALALTVAFLACVLCSGGFGSSTRTGFAGRWASPGWLIGTALFALFIGDWVRQLAYSFAPYADHTTLAMITTWVAPAGIGVAIILVGVHTAGRIIATLGALLFLWLTPAAITAASSVLGSRVVLKFWQDAPEYALGVLRSYLAIPELALSPLVAAAVIALIGLTLRYILAGRSRR